MYKLLALNKSPSGEIDQHRFDPDSYVCGQCQGTVHAVHGKVDVNMGIGVDAFRKRKDQRVCVPDIVRWSVLSTHRAGGKGVIFSPNYAGMNLSRLDRAAQALDEHGL
jgi:hypothetical protein